MPHADGSGEPVPLQQQLAALERAAAAVPDAQQRRREWRLAKRAEAAVGSALSANKQLVLSRLRSSATGRSSDGGRSTDGGAGRAGAPHSLLHCLAPEARAALLLSLPQQQRVQALAAMSDAERAALAVALDEPARLQVRAAGPGCHASQRLLRALPQWGLHAPCHLNTCPTLAPPPQVYAELGPALSVSTDAHIWRKPLLLARLLGNMPPEQAAAQLAERASPQQQAVVLQALPPQRAAAILLAQPAAAQQRLLRSLLPGTVATLLGWLAPAAALQLLLPGSASPAAPAGSPPSSAADGSTGGWAADVVQALPDSQLSALLVAAPAAQLGRLLHQLPAPLQLRLLDKLPTGPRAVALAAVHQQEAAAARQAAASAPAAEPVAAAEPADAAPGDGSGSSLAVPAAAAAAGDAASEDGPTRAASLDPATALLAHFHQLSAAEKTHTLLMGPAGSAALLLPLLEEAELADVLLLLPQQRQAELVAALHPAQARRVAGVMRAAERRRSSLLLPQQLMAAAVAAASGEEHQAGNADGQQAGAGEEQQPARLRRASSLAQPASARGRRPSLPAAAPTARQGSSGRRGSALAPPPLERRGSRVAHVTADLGAG